MSAKTKTTSLATLVSALTEHGWEFDTEEALVRVPDPESPHVRYSGWSGRVTRMPTKNVPGVIVFAKNGADLGDSKNFTAKFTAEGKYLTPQTEGSYPFNQKGFSLKKILGQVAAYSPQALAERQAKREAERAQEEVDEAAEVLAAHTAAKETLAEARSEMLATLMSKTDMTFEQAEAVLKMVAEESTFAPLLNALYAVERTGNGFLPGKSWVSGTYVDGVKVG
jgi:hypothetical protein